MKRIMSIMLALSFIVGAATITFAQDSDTAKGKKKGKKKKGGDSTPVSTPTTK